MNPTYAIDLSLKPTTFDLWHVCLAGTVVILSLILILLLLAMVFSLARGKNRPAEPLVQQIAQPSEPVVKVVEKIVEVEKLIHAPAPEPVILKESTPDAALQLLGLLQKEARLSTSLKRTSLLTMMRILALPHVLFMKVVIKRLMSILL